MAVLVMVYGHSGSGKSASLRNFDPEQVAVINVLGKPLPFRSNMKTYITNDYGKIDTAIHSTKRKSIVIDDATYLMTGEFMRNAKVAGYQKFTDMAANFNALLMRAKELPDDVVIYFSVTASVTETVARSSRPSANCWMRRSAWKGTSPSF